MQSLIGVLIAAVGGLAPLISAFVPRLGIGFLARLGQVTPLKRAIGLVGWTVTFFSWQQSPSWSRKLALLPSSLFAMQAQFLEARRIFVDLTDPPHAAASAVHLADTAVVLGAIVDEQSIAWTYENLVPRHLINDVIGQMPVLAAY